MKRLLHLILFFTFFQMMSAEEIVTGSFSALKEAGEARLELVFEEIHGMNEEDFNKYETDWFKDKPDIVGKFYAYAEEALSPDCYLSLSKATDYTVRVIVKSINFKGNFRCDVLLLDKNNAEIGRIKDVREDGGTFGTNLNLIKDGAKHTGKKVGKMLKKYIKK